jgi:hypothetical protein
MLVGIQLGPRGGELQHLQKNPDFFPAKDARSRLHYHVFLKVFEGAATVK